MEVASTSHHQEFQAEAVKIPGVAVFGHQLAIQAQSPLQLHRHPDCGEVVIVAKGLECYQAEGRAYTVCKGQAFFSRPGEEHGSGGLYAPVSEFYWFQLDLEHPDFLFLAREQGNALKAAVSGCAEHLLPAGPEVLKLVKDCHRALSNGPGRCGPGSVFLAGLLISLVGKLFLDREEYFPGDQTIFHIQEYIELNLSEPLALDGLARRFHLSESSLHHRFRQETGYSLRNYINFRKVERAKVLLEAGMPVTDAAMELGFSSSNYFSTVFRRHTAMSPSSWIHRPGREGKEG